MTGLHIADLNFGLPGRIDLLLGIDIYADVVLQGRRDGPPGSPIAFETKFGWVLAGKINALPTPQEMVAVHHIAVFSGDDILRKFWELEESPKIESNFSPPDRAVIHHFNESHARSEDGRFVVSLPKKPSRKTPGGITKSSCAQIYIS